MEEAMLAMARAHYWSHGDFDLPGMNAMAEGLKLMGVIDGAPDWPKLIDRSFLKR
jgi:NitT/TauT family transport system substrate-binding protein